ncbi:MAG TPA: ABC transporter ATP-binding protein [Candidatus Baltobacteraceae bacterium]|jgi:ABC-2 type transport system ATP-binding protein
MSTISIRHLSKSYGAFLAVNDVSIDIPSGCVFGLLGPNGAGKTTTFKCMLGLARPSSGEVLYGDRPLAPATFEDLTYVPERSVLYEWMTIRDHLELQRRSYARYNPNRAADLLALFGLDARKRVRSTSKGMRTALAIVLAFSIEPKILVLDEPTSGLDPVNQRAVLKLIIDAAAGGTTVIFSSHQIGQVERAAEHIAIMQNGGLVLTGSVDDLKYEQKIVEGIFETDGFSTNGFGGDARISRVEKTGRILRLTVRRDSDSIASDLNGMGAQSVRVVDLNLEDIFLNAVDPSQQTADVVEGA